MISALVSIELPGVTVTNKACVIRALIRRDTHGLFAPEFQITRVESGRIQTVPVYECDSVTKERIGAIYEQLSNISKTLNDI